MVKWLKSQKMHIISAITPIARNLEIAKRIKNIGSSKLMSTYLKTSLYWILFLLRILFCRTVALSNILKDDLPKIVDSFRDGETPSTKEMQMLNIFKLLGKQVIIFSILKGEEYMDESENANIEGDNTFIDI